jgi:uncharacterized membrane protein
MIPLEQFHPIVVHFPIVFFLSLAALDTYALARNIPIGGRGGVANLSAGLAALAGLTAAAAYSLGDAALDVALAGGTTAERLATHQLLGTTTAAVLAVWGLARAAIWWRRVPIVKARAWGVVVAEIVFTVLILTTAYYGGQLVYEYGVNVTVPAK